jgi:predicted DNA-binding transcriptional regulator YafY
LARAARLLDLVQALRRRRRPATAAALATELGVSARTLYRDIATLIAQGAPIEGEAGVGYVLRPGFTLPPLMFADTEIEALVLGLRFVAARGDAILARGADDALAKIADVLPADLRERAFGVGLLVGPATPGPAPSIDVAALRTAISAERKIEIAYRDAGGKASQRVVWPIALAFFDGAQVLAAWCETRNGFRHFRIDRIGALTATKTRYPGPRSKLSAAWRREVGIEGS